ncbi:MOSC domain-containing protein [Mycoplasmatota bacterium zrk1]
MGYVESINISEKKGTKKYEIPAARFRANHGIVGDSHAGDWHRQVSFLGLESVKKMEEKGATGLCHGSFAENVTTSGLNLASYKIGTKFKIGETIQELTQIGKKCHSGCEISKQVGDCIMPREGIFTKVLQGGIVKKGDTIEVVE